MDDFIRIVDVEPRPDAMRHIKLSRVMTAWTAWFQDKLREPSLTMRILMPERVYAQYRFNGCHHRGGPRKRRSLTAIQLCNRCKKRFMRRP